MTEPANDSMLCMNNQQTTSPWKKHLDVKESHLANFKGNGVLCESTKNMETSVKALLGP